ncbi:hypothetical protein CY35_01G180200 [Sphagnum magellanicum]|nr:hypothetical protein CY35_01G180200 [Sphagnum magellanicum]
MIAGESESESPVSATSSSLGGGTSWYSATGLGSSGTGSMYSVSGIEGNSNQPSNQEPRHTRPWNGKHHPDEDDTSVSWRCHKKHFFILSNAGKPIYSRYGDEHKLAGFSATLQAIMSFVENSGDTIQLVRAGDHQIVFLVKGPLYLVSISATDEPAQALRKQLELLHGQVLLILTKSLEKCFVKNAKFDMRPLLASTDSIFASLIHAFSWNVATFLNSYSCLPLPYATRQAAGAALQATPDAGVLFGVLMCGSKVISVVGPRKGVLSPNDILLLFNFVSSSDAFRRTESFSPVCLPGYNPTAFLYAYVQYLDDACLILLTADPDGFFKLKECRSQIEVLLRESDVLPQVTNSVQRGGLRVEDLPEPGASTSSLLDSTAPSSPGIEADNELPGETSLQLVVGTGGPAGLWHFVYRSSYLDQYVASEFSPPLHTRAAQKRLFRAYQKLHASMHDGSGAGLHKMQYRRDEHHVLLSWRTSDFELYAAFDPLAEKSSAVSVCNRVCQWIRDLESEIFLLGVTPFNW